MLRTGLVISILLTIALVALAVLSPSGAGDKASALTLNLDFTRRTSPADGSFDAVVWLTNSNGAVVPFSSPPMLASARGALSALTLRGDGRHQATITPDAVNTGEYRITAAATAPGSGSRLSVARTAIVMGQVAPGWGQAISVEGLVNTAATQDSLAVSPDGQYLFLQYYPVTIRCILDGDPDGSFCQTALGPVVAPLRPNMPGASRVLSASAIQHGCPSLNFNPSPFPLPPIAQYGFRRQADGSYAEPFVFRFTGDDGCFTLFGPSVHANGDGTFRMFLSFQDPRDSSTDVYDFNFSPGSTQTLGNASFSGGAVRIDNLVLSRASVGGADVHRGNPHVHYNGSTPSLLFYDDETRSAANQYIFVSQWNGSSWNAPVALNFAPFNASGQGLTQPYFDGSQLIVREGSRLISFPYNGGAIGSAASWGPPAVLLAPLASRSQTGSLFIVGEPSVATINGQQVLYFIYGLSQADGSINLRAGFVRNGA